MSLFFRAVAIDYDGTLTTHSRPSDDVLRAIDEMRDRGVRAILCTGRVLSDLNELLPDLERRFDAVVAENGAVIASTLATPRNLAPPVPAELEHALRSRGVPLRRGRVLLDTFADHDHAVLEEMARLGLDCQIVRNRHALMILPAGVTKGSGLVQVLGDLGISRHSTIGMGDAENDHALLEACELGVAVANAVPSLRDRADIVLAERNGAGVARFLRGPLLAGAISACPRRATIRIGRFLDGTPATLPASGCNILIHGEPGAGKSWLAGLVAERLIENDYSVCVFDPEGDYEPLGRLRGAIVTDARHPPGPETLADLIRHRFSSVIIDLSRAARPEKRDYFRQVSRRLFRLRAETGLPHWIFIDEADQLLPEDDLAPDGSGLEPGGFCLVTHRPEALSPELLGAMDCRISRDIARLAADAELDARQQHEPLPWSERTVSAILETEGSARVMTAARRLCPHVRHWHKYLRQGVPPDRRFLFRDADGSGDRTAGNLAEFHRELRHASDASVTHHLLRGDFSRWIRDVLREGRLAEAIHATEDRFRVDRSIEDARGQILGAIRALHAETDAPDPGRAPPLTDAPGPDTR